MSRDTPNQHPRSHLFTMRVWQEEVGHDRTEWRGKVHLIPIRNLSYKEWWPPSFSYHHRTCFSTSFDRFCSTSIGLPNAFGSCFHAALQISRSFHCARHFTAA